MLVLAIGVLGIAALQTRALSDTGGSLNQSLGTVASYSIFDMMRADKINAIAAALPYNTTVTANSCPDGSGGLANWNLNAWCKQLAADLGARSTTSGTVACDTSGVCTVTIQYDDSKNTGGSTAQKIITKAGL